MGGSTGADPQTTPGDIPFDEKTVVAACSRSATS